MHETDDDRKVAEARYVVQFVAGCEAKGIVPDVEAALRYRRGAIDLTIALERYCFNAPSL